MAQVVAETYPGHAFYGPCGLHHHRCFTLADVLQMAGQGTCFLEGQGFLQNAEIEVEIGEIRLVQFLDGRAKSNEAPVLKLSLRTWREGSSCIKEGERQLNQKTCLCMSQHLLQKAPQYCHKHLCLEGSWIETILLQIPQVTSNHFIFTAPSPWPGPFLMPLPLPLAAVPLPTPSVVPRRRNTSGCTLLEAVTRWPHVGHRSTNNKLQVVKVC